MWRDILKESKQTSRQVGSLNWDEEEIPEKEDKDCIKKLLNIYDRANQISGGANSGTILREVNRGSIKEFPEELICKALDLFKKMVPKDYKNINKGDFLSNGKKVSDQEYVILVYKLYPSVGSHKIITGFDAYNKGVQLKDFEIVINYFDPSWPEVEGDSVDLDNARGKNYLNACKYVFGEYF
jgi:hypothetical protein